MKDLKQNFEMLAGEDLPDWDQFAKHTQLQKLVTGSEFIRTGEPAPWIIFIRKGLIKLHYIDENGLERIKNFVTDSGIIASISALKSNGISTFSATTLSETEILRIPYLTLQELAQNHLGWSQLLINTLMNYAAQKEAREQSFLMQTAEQRFVSLKSENPDLIKTVSQKDLASYLGVTPVGLSRIKTRLNRISNSSS